MGYTFEELRDDGYPLFKQRYTRPGDTENDIRGRWTDARRGRIRRDAEDVTDETRYMSKKERAAYRAGKQSATEVPPAPTIGELVARETARLDAEYDAKNDGRFLRDAVRTIEADLALKRERRLLAEYERKEAARNLFLEGVREAVRPIAYLPTVYAPPARPLDIPVRAAVGLWSDLHAGKGTATFNEEVARRRVRQVIRETIAAVEKERTEARVDTYHMLLLGDLCDGANIYPTQAYHSEQNVLNQIFRVAAPILAEAIRDLAPHFSRLVVATVPGNHGRVSKFHHEEDNADNYLYETVRLMTERIPCVEWRMNARWFAIHPVFDTRILMVHGQQHKIAYSVPFYALTRKALGWHATMDEEFDIEVCGHFHTPNHINCNDINLVMNGAFVGDDDFALEVLAAKSAPAQTMLVIDERRGLTQRTVFTLD